VVEIRNIEDVQLKVVVTCADCGAVLNSTVPMTADELWRQWARLVVSSGLATGPCPKGCRSTFSDCNINTDLRIEAGEGVLVTMEALNKLRGQFYSSDYDAVCLCKSRSDNECFQSSTYPAVHGKCGKWLTPYQSRAKGDSVRG
jgi:hypothetical protein